MLQFVRMEYVVVVEKGHILSSSHVETGISGAADALIFLGVNDEVVVILAN
jgi:hypothetical protein